MKNEHIVWAYAEREDDTGQVVICGLTDVGLKHLKSRAGETLVINPPGKGFANVTQIVVFAAKDKAELKALFHAAGVVVSEVN